MCNAFILGHLQEGVFERFLCRGRSRARSVTPLKPLRSKGLQEQQGLFVRTTRKGVIAEVSPKQSFSRVRCVSFRYIDASDEG